MPTPWWWDGFGQYGTGQSPAGLIAGARFVSGSTSKCRVLLVNGRRWLESYVSGGAADPNLVTVAFPDVSTICIGFRTRPASGSYSPLIAFRDGASRLGGIYRDSGSAFSYRRAYNSGSQSVSTLGIAQGVEGYLECKIVFHDTTGSVQWKVNNADAGTDTGLDTIGAGSLCDNLLLGGPWPNEHWLFGGELFSDMYLADDFLGPQKVDEDVASSDGDLTQWNTLGAGTHTAEVDDSDGPDGDASYIYENNVGDDFLLNFPGFADDPTAVQIIFSARNEGATGGITPLCKVGGTVYTGTTKNPGSTYENLVQQYLTNPDTASAWQKTDTPQFGARLAS